MKMNNELYKESTKEEKNISNLYDIFYESSKKQMIVTIILNSNNPDIQGIISEVGKDYVSIKTKSTVSPIQFIPFFSISNFWFNTNN